MRCAVELVFSCFTNYPQPESTSQTHNAANRFRRGEKPGGSLF